MPTSRCWTSRIRSSKSRQPDPPRYVDRGLRLRCCQAAVGRRAGTRRSGPTWASGRSGFLHEPPAKWAQHCCAHWYWSGHDSHQVPARLARLWRQLGVTDGQRGLPDGTRAWAIAFFYAIGTAAGVRKAHQDQRGRPDRARFHDRRVADDRPASLPSSSPSTSSNRAWRASPSPQRGRHLSRNDVGATPEGHGAGYD
jgi:hypothetical protein